MSSPPVNHPQRSLVFANCDMTYVPVFHSGIIKACDNVPPIKIKNKGSYMLHERNRWAQRFNIPMKENQPPGFPANTLPIQRALTAINIMFPEQLVETIELLYRASFAEHQPVHERACLAALLERIFGVERTEQLLQRSTSEDVKSLLTERTNGVVAQGSFGVPWFIATDTYGKTDHFWGFDNIGLVADHLGLDRPKASNGGERGWRAML